MKKYKVIDAQVNKKLINDEWKLEEIKNKKPKPPVVITDTEHGGERDNDTKPKEPKVPRAPAWFGGAMKTALNPIETRLDRLEARLTKVEMDVSGVKTTLKQQGEFNQVVTDYMKDQKAVNKEFTEFMKDQKAVNKEFTDFMKDQKSANKEFTDYMKSHP